MQMQAVPAHLVGECADIHEASSGEEGVICIRRKHPQYGNQANLRAFSVKLQVRLSDLTLSLSSSSRAEPANPKPYTSEPLNPLKLGDEVWRSLVVFESQPRESNSWPKP